MASTMFQTQSSTRSSLSLAKQSSTSSSRPQRLPCSQTPKLKIRQSISLKSSLVNVKFPSRVAVAARKALRVDAMAAAWDKPAAVEAVEEAKPEHDPPPTRVVSTNSGKEVFAKLVDTGVFRSQLPIATVLMQSIMAGCFIGFGGILCSSVGGDVGAIGAANPGLQRFLFGAIGFPLSIFLVTLTEMHAFTASLCLYTAAVAEGYTKKTRMTQVLTATWIGNTIGLILMAFLAVQGNMDCVLPCWDISNHKLSATWWEIFCRGIGGGWLVCMAVVLATTANDVISKFIGIWMCISTYVICGWEHGLANIFFIPCAIFSGAPITWQAFIQDSLIPSTLGNTVGGIVMVGMALAQVHSAKKDEMVFGSSSIKLQSPISFGRD